MKKKNIEKLIKSKELVSIYTNENSESFEVGVCLACDEEYLIYNSINKFGEDDGLVCVRIDDIFKISYNGKYEKMIKKLWSPLSYEDFTIDSKNVLLSFLKNVQERNKIVYVECFEDEEEAIIGYIEDADENTITIKYYDCYGEYDGTSLFSLDSVSVFIYNSKITRKIERLIG